MAMSFHLLVRSSLKSCAAKIARRACSEQKKWVTLTTHLFRLELELASTTRRRDNCILFLIIARSFLAHRYQKHNPLANILRSGPK
jgi:hypothetical protein